MKEIVERRSIRKYTAEKIDEETIVKIIESARLAPSGSNTQPWKFLVIDDSKVIDEFSVLNNNQAWIRNSSHLIVCLADASARFDDYENVKFNEDSSDYEFKQLIRDSSIANTHILLEAHNQGVGACMLAWYTQESAKKLFGIPDYMFITCVITLGYPDERPEPRKRKDLDEILFFNKLKND